MNQKRPVTKSLLCAVLILMAGGALFMRTIGIIEVTEHRERPFETQSRLEKSGRDRILSEPSLLKSSSTSSMTKIPRTDTAARQKGDIASLKNLKVEIAALENEIERGDVIARINSDRTDVRERQELMGKIHKLADLRTRLASVELDEIETELRVLKEVRK